jgi:hypothetical protein
MSIARLLSLCSLASLGLAVAIAGCGSSSDTGDAGVHYGDAGPIFVTHTDGGSSTPAPPQCILATKQCVSTTCAAGSTTSISGDIYDPAENNPLYGIVVYVPSTPPAAITTGASCLSCSALYTGNPIVSTVTDASGKFTLTGVPDGAKIPLVVQVGKWRTQYVLPNVTACQNNDAPTLLNTKLKLPNNHMVGDIPSIGISTGAADSLECLLVRIGVDEAEYGGGPGGTGRVHIFHTDNPATGPGSDTVPPAPIAYQALWDSQADLMAYDITLLTCEGAETGMPNRQVLFDYAQAGGRVFASHFHYSWFNTGPFAAENLAAWTPGPQEYGGANGTVDAVIETTLPGGGVFPRGVAMQQWLSNVGALLTTGPSAGELQLDQARHNALVTAANTPSVPWIVSDMNAQPPNETEYFSFDTPFGVAAAEQCGRVVYSDLHVGAASMDYSALGPGQGGFIPAGATVPSGCTMGQLSDQEKALEFMLFDLSGCITPSNQGAGGIPPSTPQ